MVTAELPFDARGFFSYKVYDALDLCDNEAAAVFGCGGDGQHILR